MLRIITTMIVKAGRGTVTDEWDNGTRRCRFIGHQSFWKILIVRARRSTGQVLHRSAIGHVLLSGIVLGVRLSVQTMLLHKTDSLCFVLVKTGLLVARRSRSYCILPALRHDQPEAAQHARRRAPDTEDQEDQFVVAERQRLGSG